MNQKVEIRCPVGPQGLLSKLTLTGSPPYVNDDNLMELSCDWCSRSGESNKRVVHRYNFIGELVDTIVEKKS